MSGGSTDINRAAGAFEPLNGPNVSTVAIAATTAAASVALPQVQGSGTLGGQPVVAPGEGSTTFVIDNTGAPASTIVETSPTPVFIPATYAFVAFANTSAAATAAATISTGATPGAYPCPPGVKTVITVRGNPQFAAAILSAGSPATTIYITPGNGKL
jgi:hypothetical protein